MPNIFRREGSPCWYGRFQYRGKDYIFSTGEKERTAAKEALEAKRAEITGDNLSPMLDRVVESLLSLIEKLPGEERDAKRVEICKQIMLDHSCTLKIDDAWRAWLEIPKKTTEATIRGYDAVWKRFSTWAKTRGNGYLHEVTESAVQDYVAHLWKSNVTPSTYNMHKRFLAGMFRKLKGKTGLLVNPWDSVTSLEKEQESRRNLSKEELRNVIGAATGNMRAMLTIGLFTGLRLADVVNLHKDAINFADGFVEVMPMKTKRKKKKVRIPIHSLLVPTLSELVATAADGYLFPDEQARHALSSANITKALQAHFEACGIKTNEEIGDGHRRRAIVRVGFHSLRHSFVSLCAAGGTPQHVIQELVGHGSPAMTDIYTHVDEKQTIRAVAVLKSDVLPAKPRDAKRETQ